MYKNKGRLFSVQNQPTSKTDESFFIEKALSTGYSVEEIQINQIIKTFEFFYLHCLYFNPFNAEATFYQSTAMQRFLKTIETLSCWYTLDSSR